MKSKPQQTTTTISVFLFTINFHYDDDDNQRRKKLTLTYLTVLFSITNNNIIRNPKKIPIVWLIICFSCVYFSLLFSFQNYKHASCVCVCLCSFYYSRVRQTKQSSSVRNVMFVCLLDSWSMFWWRTANSVCIKFSHIT